MKKTSDTSFGALLRDYRRKAGDLSLEEVVVKYAAMAKGKDAGTLSRSLLSLYERGKIDTPKPETFRILSGIYKVKYEDLASAWFRGRYGVPLKNEAMLIGENNGSYRIQSPSKRGGVTLITLERHKRNQATLPRGSEVAVAAVNFLDDKGDFFDLVAANLLRGIKYCYLLSEEQRIEVEAFREKLCASSRALREKLKDPQLLRFIARPTLALPMSYVLYLLPDGEVRAFLALPEDEFASFYLAAEPRLALGLYESFRWSATLSEAYETRRALAVLSLEVEQKRKLSSRKKLGAF